jgi:hypothetical protein
MATSSSIKRLSPKFQSVFGLLTPSDDAEIRNILNSVDEMLLEFAKYFGSNRAGWEGTGLDLIWFPSGQTKISSFVGAGIDDRVDFIVSLQPTWFYNDFPTKQEWAIEATIDADCQHKVYCGNMHCVRELPSLTSTNPIDSVKALRSMTTALIQLGKEKPIEYWFQLAGDDQSQ